MFNYILQQFGFCVAGGTATEVAAAEETADIAVAQEERQSRSLTRGPRRRPMSSPPGRVIATGRKSHSVSGMPIDVSKFRHKVDNFRAGAVSKCLKQ